MLTSWGGETNCGYRLSDVGMDGGCDLGATNRDSLIFVVHGCKRSRSSGDVAPNICDMAM